ncbi:MAG: hypothetical protein AB1490_30830 [Pseudomonadota bacterium]
MFGRVIRSLSLCAGLAVCASLSPVAAQEQLKYPQIIHYRYEATEPKGGHFLLWVEREKIWYGLDPRLYPAAKSVDVTHVTPGQGLSTITTVAVTPINGGQPDYFHLLGIVRFKITGMAITSTNVPPAAP